MTIINNCPTREPPRVLCLKNVKFIKGSRGSDHTKAGSHRSTRPRAEPTATSKGPHEETQKDGFCAQATGRRRRRGDTVSIWRRSPSPLPRVRNDSRLSAPSTVAARGLHAIAAAVRVQRTNLSQVYISPRTRIKARSEGGWKEQERNAGTSTSGNKARLTRSFHLHANHDSPRTAGTNALTRRTFQGFCLPAGTRSTGRRGPRRKVRKRGSVRPCSVNYETATARSSACVAALIRVRRRPRKHIPDDNRAVARKRSAGIGTLGNRRYFFRNET